MGHFLGGYQIGNFSGEQDPAQSAEGSMKLMQSGSNKMIKSSNKKILIQFLLSKDDNLLLLVGGLFHSVFQCKTIPDNLWQIAPEIAIH